MANQPPISGLEKICLNNMAVDDIITMPEITAEVDNCFEHPVAWFKKYNVQREEIYHDVLCAILDLKNMILEIYQQNISEDVKWKLFGYNLIICYEYTSKGDTEKALEIIGDIEHILTSIGNDDQFLSSIKIALNHITFSFKGHLLELCSLETSMLIESFIMPNEMDHVNKAALYGAQALFFNKYGVVGALTAEDCAFKAISINKNEAEWYYLLAKVFTDCQQTHGNYNLIIKHETDAAEKAVELGKNDKYKVHLAFVYQRRSRYRTISDPETRENFANTGIKLVKEVIMKGTDDLLLLKNCLLRLLKLPFENGNVETNEMIEKLVDKLSKSSGNAYIHVAIGNYYMLKKKDYEKANFHLKKAFEVKSFGYSLDYIYTFYKIDPNTTQVEPLLVEMLKMFPHPFKQEIILSQLTSYLIVTKKDLIQALKYIPQLLSLKHVTCVYSIQIHRMKFSSSKKCINLIHLLTDKLGAASMEYSLRSDDLKRVTEVMQLLESYKQFVSRVMEENKHIFDNNYFQKNVPAKNNKSFSRDRKEMWCYNNPKPDSISTKNKDKENWRSLTPDSVVRPYIFSRDHRNQKSTSGLEIKNSLNSQK